MTGIFTGIYALSRLAMQYTTSPLTYYPVFDMNVSKVLQDIEKKLGKLPSQIPHTDMKQVLTQLTRVNRRLKQISESWIRGGESDEEGDDIEVSDASGTGRKRGRSSDEEDVQACQKMRKQTRSRRRKKQGSSLGSPHDRRSRGPEQLAEVRIH